MAKRPNAKGRNNAPGGFAGIPRVVMETDDYKGLSGGAVKLLLELASQYRGNNNGDLTVAFSVLKDKGFNSKVTIRRGVSELLLAGMIVETRPGKFINPGGVCALYAITWTSVDECSGKKLVVGPTQVPLRKFSVELSKKPGPETGLGWVQKMDRKRQRDGRGRFLSVQKLDR